MPTGLIDGVNVDLITSRIELTSVLSIRKLQKCAKELKLHEGLISAQKVLF